MISPDRTKQKRLSLCVSMEIGQCRARVLRDTLIMNRKWETQTREEDVSLFPLTDHCDNDTRTCFGRKWKWYALVCLMKIDWRVELFMPWLWEFIRFAVSTSLLQMSVSEDSKQLISLSVMEREIHQHQNIYYLLDCFFVFCVLCLLF